MASFSSDESDSSVDLSDYQTSVLDSKSFGSSSASTSGESIDIIDLTQTSSEEVSSDSSDEITIQYLNDNKSLPIFSRQSKLRTSALVTVQAILDSPPSLRSSSHPTNININCAFVVDTSEICDPEDIKCDDCGAWKQTKTATTNIMITFMEDGSVCNVEKLAGAVRPNKSYILIRRHYVCKSAPDLSQHISSLTNPHGIMEPCQFIQYRFSGKEHSVAVKPHGNSKKSKRPYKRTCPSTFKELSEETTLYPPKRAAFRVEQRRGGIFNATCEGDLPRNTSQVSRIKSKKSAIPSLVKCNDPVQALVIKFKEQSGNPDQYIQAIHLVPDPTITLFNMCQLDAMEHFCCSVGKTSVLGVDVTFNLGPFYVTMCTYQNLKIVNNSGIHPIMIGPTLIHSSKEQSNFSVLFHEIVKRKPSLSSVKAYGTDGEQAIANAASEAFPFAVHLRCANHLRDNITANLRKMPVPDIMTKQVLADIFGTSVEKGLIHAPSRDFSSKLEVLEERWGTLEKVHKVKRSGVFKWFKVNVAPIIRDNLNMELISSLGVDGEKYTQNNSEAANALVKRYVNFKKQDVFQFVTDLEECVREQQNEVSKSIVGLGRWNLEQSCTHLKQNGGVWFGTMSQAQKQDVVSSFRSFASRNSAVSTSRDRCPVVDEIPTDESAAVVSSPTMKSLQPLSIPYKAIAGTFSDGELQSMWSKASQLLSDGKVIAAPGSTSKTWWVSSASSNAPHVVSTSKTGNGRYMCDNQCIGWKSRSICAHCLAAAESDDHLFDFLAWFRSSNLSKKDNGLTRAVYHGTYKHAGKKHPPRRKYGDVVHLPLVEKVDRIPLTDLNLRQCIREQSLGSGRHRSSDAGANGACAAFDSSWYDSAGDTPYSDWHSSSGAALDSGGQGSSGAAVNRSGCDPSGAALDNGGQGSPGAALDSGGHGSSGAALDSGELGSSGAALDSGGRGSSGAALNSGGQGSSGTGGRSSETELRSSGELNICGFTGGLNIGGLEGMSSEAGLNVEGLEGASLEAGLNVGGLEGASSEAGLNVGGLKGASSEAGLNVGGFEGASSEAGFSVGGLSVESSGAGLNIGGLGSGFNGLEGGASGARLRLEGGVSRNNSTPFPAAIISSPGTQVGGCAVNVVSLAQSPQLLSTLTSLLTNISHTQVPLGSLQSTAPRTQFAPKPATIKSNKPFFLTIASKSALDVVSCLEIWLTLTQLNLS